MWNFNYAIPSLMILAVIVGHYISLPRLPLIKNRLFLYLVVIESLDMTLDVFSSWADTYYQLFPMWVLYVLNGAYFILFFARSFAFFLFTTNALNIDFRNKIFLICITELPLNIGILLILIAPWTKWFFYIDETGYHSGPLYNTIYFFFGIYLIISFILITLNRSIFIRKRELQILLGCNTVLTIGLILRYLFPNVLLMNVFCLAAFIVLYLGFANPDAYLIERTFIYNKTALSDYLFELNGIHSINALVFGARNYIDKLDLYGVQQTNKGIYLIQAYLRKTFPNFHIFNYGNGKFVFLTTEEIDWKPVYATLKERFENPWIAENTEMYLDICGGIIALDETKLPFEVLSRIFYETSINSEKNVSDELLTIHNGNIHSLLDEIDIKRSLENAIANDAVEVFFQPIIDSTTREIAGAEALARIRNSDGNLIPPAVFIPIAEQNGKIYQLGKQVFKKCCQYLNQSDFKATNLNFLNVNLSPLQFIRMDLDKTLSQYITETGTKADMIHLEITEEALVDDQLMEKQISSLTNIGFKFVLDDYGKGYSNMSRLRKTPFINIKLDMSLVWDYCKNPDQILPNEVKAFTNSGFDVTAEGIEDEDMAIKMRDIGCRYLQGYYFSKPLPVDEFIQKYRRPV